MAKMTIMDYIGQQMEQFDSVINIIKEQSVLAFVSNQYEVFIDRVESTATIYGGITSLAGMMTLTNKIVECIQLFNNTVGKELQKQTKEYQMIGYGHMGEIIDMAKELYAQQTKISEMKMYDPQTITNISDHAFEQVRGFTDEKITYVREEMNKLFNDGKYTQDNIAKVLEVVVGDKARARTIAQTEMSMAYNKGVLERLYEFQAISGEHVMKYWYGFKYSESTCNHCRPHIKEIFELDDNTYTLPVHPNCRCVWLPYVEGWDSPISVDITRNADMLKRVYSVEEVYNKINKRLGINYAQYLADGVGQQYLSGKRGEDMAKQFDLARNIAVDKYMNEFGVKLNSPTKTLSAEYNQQMAFWVKYLADNMADNTQENLVSATKAIKGVMALPWSGSQLAEFNKLINKVDEYLNK